MAIHLTAFGFTPTEERVYSALLDRGPTSAYHLARQLNVARANVYQALNGLRNKGAAVLTHDRPQMFRPVTPESLLALVSERESAKLDALEKELRGLAPIGEAKTGEFLGERAFREIALRIAARSAFASCAAPEAIQRALVPLWRKRAADSLETKLWVVGDSASSLPIETLGTIPERVVFDRFGALVTIMVTPTIAVLAQLEDEWRGYWSSDALVVRTVAMALDQLTVVP